MKPTANQPQANKEKRRFKPARLLRLSIASILITSIGLVLVLPILAGWMYMWATTHPPCAARPITPANFGLAYREISIPARWGGTYRGYFMPGRLPALIIVPPAFAGGRDGMLEEATILAAHGYNVVTFESRVCSSKGMISLGYREVDDVGDVLDYLKQNPENLSIPPDALKRIGMHGFSSAGATSTMAAARYPEVGALLTEGGYHTMTALTGLGETDNWLEGLRNFGSQIAYRLGTGEDPHNLDPIGAIPKIAPRPIFFVYGGAEPSLPGARLQLAAAQAAAPDMMTALWVVPNAGHGGYLYSVGRDEYARWVLPFYDCALLGQACEQWRALWKPISPDQTF